MNSTTGTITVTPGGTIPMETETVDTELVPDSSTATPTEPSQPNSEPNSGPSNSDPSPASSAAAPAGYLNAALGNPPASVKQAPPDQMETIRLTYKIAIPQKSSVGGDMTPFDYVRQQFLDMSLQYKNLDDSIVLMTWNETSTEPSIPIVTFETFPKVKSKLIPYWQGLKNPKWGKPDTPYQAFFKSRWGYLGNRSTFPWNGDLESWFDDRGHGAFPTTVQNSSDEEIIGFMRFSTNCVDIDRFLDIFHKRCRGRFLVDGSMFNRMKVGCKVQATNQSSLNQRRTGSIEPIPDVNLTACHMTSCG